MRRELLLPTALLVVGIAVTVVNMVSAFGSGDSFAFPGGTSIGPVIVFLGLVAFGRAWHGEAPVG